MYEELFHVNEPFCSLRKITFLPTCKCYYSIPDYSVRFKAHIFPLLTCIPPEHEVVGHSPDKYSKSAFLFYMLERNKQALHNATVAFLCMRKAYPQVDKNVIRAICYSYLVLPDRDSCVVSESEREITNAWKEIDFDSKMKKSDKAIKVAKAKRERINGRLQRLNAEIEVLKEKKQKLSNEYTDQQMELDELSKENELLTKKEEFFFFVGKKEIKK
jgi:FtsZ-binding cell division protein ZapB